MFIGKKFVTRYDAYLWKMEPHQFDMMPYRLKSIKLNPSRVSPYGKFEVFIPAGTVIVVRDAKLSYLGGDWDFILAELQRPDTKVVVVFEELLGFSNVDPREFLELYAPLDKVEFPPNAKANN